MLAALNEAEREEDLPTEVVLDPADELSYARIIGSIADAGPCALVDGYFTINSLLDIIQRTHVERVLVRPNGGRVAALGQAVQDLRIERPFEIRASDDFHDRFVVPDEGDVRFIGTSLSGVGRRLALTGLISDPAAAAIRESFEDSWNCGSPIATAPVNDDAEVLEEDSPSVSDG